MRILVVDDDEGIIEVLSDILSDEGYLVASAGDGSAALQTLTAQETPDVILLDLVMPTMSGAELLTQLRADPALAQVPVVVMTGETRHEQIASRVAGYLVKPLDLEQLLSTLERAAASHGHAAGQHWLH